MGGASLSRNLKEEAKAYSTKEVPRAGDDVGNESSDNDGTESGDEDSDMDQLEEEKNSRNDLSPLFPAVLMSLLVLEHTRRVVFKYDTKGAGRRGYGEEEMEKELADIQKRLEMFDGLGNTRREELAIAKHHERNSNEEINREGTKRWVEEVGTENQKNDINRMLEALGRQRKERCLSVLETEGNLVEENAGNGDLREILIDQESEDFMSTISQYIVLESNLVTCGAGLEIHRITPGYDLCQISLQLPIETTGTEIVEMLLEEGLDTTDFHILRIKETGERLEATILTNIQFGNALEHKEEAFSNRKIGFEVRRDAIWASGAMGPGTTPSLVLTWDSENFGSSLSEEIALAAVYDNLFELEGARMESCCLVSPESESESTVNQVTLTVEFDNWGNVFQAARDIESKRPDIPSFQAKTPNAHHHSIVIPLPQYGAQRRQWLELSEAGSEEGWVETENTDNEVVIRVQGENKALVGALKVRAEKIARGEILDGAYWHPSFESTEESASFFSEVMQLAYLKCCSDTHTLALYGEFGEIEKARKMIEDEVKRREQIPTKTTLTEPSITFFKSGGIQKLKELVGDEEVDLRSTSRWSAVMMRGGEVATHHLRRLIKESLLKKEIASQDATIAITCPVCLEEPLHPEILECGHGYCSGCFNLFLDAAGDTQRFPIVCVGDGVTCNVPIALPLIRRFLPRHSFKQLVEAAFVTYLQRNPTQFRYCKTPDCRQTYRQRTEDKATIITCPSCFAKTCSSCSEDHENMPVTCTEYRILRDPEEQERLNNELADNSGYKRCPRCAVWVEKTGGCNHMNCKCGVHICWICLGIFDAETIYGHIASH